MFKRVVLVFVGLVYSFALSAVQVDKLYQSVASVKTQSPDERSVAFTETLQHVLLKVSGDKSVLSHPAIAAEISSAERYVLQYGYVSTDNPDFPYKLNVSFIEKSIQQLLSSNGLPIWGSNRPSVLFWLAIEAEGARSVISSSVDNELIAEIESQSAYRGLPLYLPVMDLQDSSALSVSDLWGLFMDPVVKASARYNPDAVVAMQLYQSTLGEWKGRWTLQRNGSAFSALVQAATKQEAVTQAINDVASILASQYAVSGDSAGNNDRLEIEISNVGSYADYVELYKYVESLSPVVWSQVIWVKEDQVRIRLQTSGSIEQFEQHVSLDSKIKPEMASVGEAGDSFRLYYRWQP
ncbi:MAG: DUF2066 domain-containing protein [Hahellaceae bacterium]|nr:DUF2066 domain-containing protein [Hahellaceae bacterium]MCP5213210.1 DUF2066 domain-containing protein [Hahellaceae bacterium]